MLKQKKENPPEIKNFAPLGKYNWRQRLKIRVIDFLLYGFMYLLGKTIRFEIEGWKNLDIQDWENFEEAWAKKPATINVFWHNRILLMTYYWRKHGSAVLVSQSFDGEYIARTAQRFGYGVIRGSSTRGGSKALKQMLKLLRNGTTMTFTIDGPKGPRYKVKKGSLLLAKQTGVPVLPILIEAEKFWTINSWDKLQIPKPFTKAKVFMGEPVFIERDADKDLIELKQAEVQRKLDELVETGKQWRIGQQIS